MIVNILLAAFCTIILYCVLSRVVATKKMMSGSFLSKESTGALRGISIIAITFAHICQAEPQLVGSLVGGKYTYTIMFTWGGIGVAIFFLLSGYGCFLSINKTDSNLQWAIKHIIKMILYFIICFIIVILVRTLALGETISLTECAECFFTLKLPGTSSWYFKIQILFYILLAISNRIKANQCYVISVLVLLYAAVTSLGGLPDYWWKTSMCFVSGCLIAKYRDVVSQYASKIYVNVGLLFLGLASFIYTRIDFHYIFIPQLIAYVFISVCIVIIWNNIDGKNKVLDLVGKASLAMYLIHTGVVDTVYSLTLTTNIKTIVFIFIVVIGTTISYQMTERINKAIAKKC